jgi:hypothetical protein
MAVLFFSSALWQCRVHFTTPSNSDATQWASLEFCMQWYFTGRQPSFGFLGCNLYFRSPCSTTTVHRRSECTCLTPIPTPCALCTAHALFASPANAKTSICVSRNVPWFNRFPRRLCLRCSCKWQAAVSVLKHRGGGKKIWTGHFAAGS